MYGSLSGILLAYLYEKYGSIKAPILAHILMNIVALTLTEANIFVWMFKDIMRMSVITILCAAAASTIFLFIQ
ncbi:MAG: CPBP family intramembrane metalloprotease, partial [Clostridia bacterium]|nr:CPBP family intramembrane metalloprotease [Clostridia bacterium]